MACYDSYGILFKLHHRLLHKLSAEVGLPCQGVSQAARILRKNGKLSSNMTKRIVGLDTAFHIIRHLTQEKAVDFFIKVEKDVCYTSGGDTSHGNPDGGSAGGGTVDSKPVQQRRKKKDEEELVASPTSACPTEEALTDNEQEEGSTSPPTAAAMTPATAASSLAAATSPAVAIPACGSVPNAKEESSASLKALEVCSTSRKDQEESSSVRRGLEDGSTACKVLEGRVFEHRDFKVGDILISPKGGKLYIIRDDRRPICGGRGWRTQYESDRGTAHGSHWTNEELVSLLKQGYSFVS